MTFTNASTVDFSLMCPFTFNIIYNIIFFTQVIELMNTKEVMSITSTLEEGQASV